MPIITKVETSLTYWNHQYDIPESLFVKHFGSVEAFEKDHTDDQGMLLENAMTQKFLEDVEAEISDAAECVDSVQAESAKHNPTPEYFNGKIVKFDRTIERQG